MGPVRTPSSESGLASSGPVVCIGGGPAGLACALALAEKGVPVTVYDRDPQFIGGISRTVVFDGFGIDIGGHRFFTKSREVQELWEDLMGPEFLERDRKSRIYYRSNLFAYPLQATDALIKLGLFETFLCIASYAYARLFPIPNPKNFQDWVTNQFGRRLFSIFFESYTEKVWGMRCTELSADWAAQRIKGLSLSRAIINALQPRWLKRGPVVKTLVESFRYPRRGPGMMWEAATARIRSLGGTVVQGATVTGAEWNAAEALWTVSVRDGAGETRTVPARHLVSTTAIRDLISSLSPTLPAEAQAAARGLGYRDFLIVGLVLKDRQRFDDNWIYIHEPSVQVARIQNFKSWSPEMVPDAALTCYGMEYFCFDTEDLWSRADADLIAMASKELIHLKLAEEGDIVGGHVVRQPKAYPVYDDSYQQRVTTICTALDQHFPTLHLCGRNGLHRYNNQDHSVITGRLVAANILAGSRVYDVWRVNQDAEYLEEGEAGTK